MIELRDYQQESVDAVFDYFGRATGNPLVALPTGSGKSLVLAEIIRRALEQYPETRVLVATHRQELITQDAAAILRLWPQAPVGIYSAGLFSRQIAPITVGGVQSLHDKADELGERHLVFVDEAHLVPHSDDGMYRNLLRALAAKNEKTKVVGLTATPYRLDGGSLVRGKNKIFSSICYSADVRRLVAEGWLAAVSTPDVALAVDTANVKTVKGDWAVGQLAEKSMEVTADALNEAIELSRGRRARLVFCVSVEHAEQAAAYIESRGLPAQVITGETPPDERRRTIEQFRAGNVPWLVGVDVLTTGFDAPVCDCIVLLRPTQSCGLYVQIVGRGMRTSPGKTDCMLLDYGGNVERHGPIDDVRPHSQGTGKSERPDAKICKQCDAEVALTKKECPECGTPFPENPRPVDHQKTATRAAAMSAPPVASDWIEISESKFYPWKKKDKPTSMCAEHERGYMSSVREWICFEHGGYAQQKAWKWWIERGGSKPYPATVDAAIARIKELRKIEALKTIADGEFYRVSEVRLAAPREPGSDDDADNEGPAQMEIGTPAPDAWSADQFVDDDALPF